MHKLQWKLNLYTSGKQVRSFSLYLLSLCCEGDADVPSSTTLGCDMQMFVHKAECGEAAELAESVSLCLFLVSSFAFAFVS